MLVLIFFSSVTLALEEPGLDDNSNLARFLNTAEPIVTVLFLIEMILKIIVQGFIFCKQAYLRYSWNVIDFFVVVVSLISFAGHSSAQLGAFKSLRAMRALRPLRLLSQFKSMRMVVESILATIPALLNVVAVSLNFFVMFSVIGVNFFQGRMRRCIDLAGNVLPVDEVNCLAPNIWKNQNWNFDHMVSSLLVLFELASLESWPTIMLDIIDSTAPGLAPKINATPEAAVFVMVFILVGSFFVMSLFVGVVVDEYAIKYRLFTGEGVLTDHQLHYIEAYKDMLYSGPHVVDYPATKVWFSGFDLRVRNAVFKWVTNPKFEKFILSCIIVNSICMCFDYYGASQQWNDVLEALNTAFYCIFFLEFLLKLLGLGARQYFRDRWNQFDSFIVLVSTVSFIVRAAGATNYIDPTLFRVFRILRLFRIIKRAKGLRQLIQTLTFSLPALLNVGLLMLLLFFLYAILGMNLLSHIKIQNNGGLSDHVNFKSFFTALLTLFRMATGENWNIIMHECMIAPPFCTAGVDCGSVAVAVPFFISFHIFSALLMLNVFVAVVLKNFEEEV